MWHWVNALCIALLAATGYVIAAPPWRDLAGEAGDLFVMGYVRYVHFAAGYVFAIGLLARVYMALVGDRYAREIFVLPVRDRAWWGEVWWQWRWYWFRVDAPRQYRGHDPLAQLTMVLLFTLPATLMMLSGFALYAEGLGAGSWADHLFGWMRPLFGQSQGLHSWHHLGMWGLLIFSAVHIYAALREELWARRSILSAMISGERIFRGDPPPE